MAKKKKHSKGKVLLKGTSLHILSYIIIAAVLFMFNVPPLIVFVIFMVLLWALFVLSYHYHRHK